jgi:hypothetical protein
MQSMFLGLQSSDQITAFGLNVEAASSSISSAAIRMGSSGLQSSFVNNSQSIDGAWVTPTTSADNWEVRATVISGSTPTGSSVGSWLALTSDRTWTITASVEGTTVTGTIQLEFRRASDLAVDANTPTFTLTAERFDRF